MKCIDELRNDLLGNAGELIVMLEDIFDAVYSKFKLHFYQKMFEQIQAQETALTPIETFCVEVIHELGSPTVNEFANFINVTPPNAAYKVSSLLQKGYIEKIQSLDDKREYHLQVTDEYYKYYNLSQNYVHEVVGRMREHLSEEELSVMEHCMTQIVNDMMPEITLPE